MSEESAKLIDRKRKTFATFAVRFQKKEKMSLKCGIVGLPNVGKSTLFNCVSSGKAQSANFPFCTIEPNIGSTIVPDKRLDVLNELCHPKSLVPATVEIVDIAGLVERARERVSATSFSRISERLTPFFTCFAASTTRTSCTWKALLTR